MKHRKLFPTSTETNSRIECPDSCDSSCPIKCYPYSDYFFPPPPPPPPSSPPYSLQGHHITPYVIIIVSFLASFFLLVSYHVIIAESCPGWCSLRNNRRLQPPAESSDEEFLDGNQVDHPIWFITTTGLQQSIINSITVCKYKKDEGLIEGTECSICLGEFEQDETLRLLPKCNHAFHISCIDTWLRSHTNCPLCRAHIVSEGISTPLVSVNQNPDNLNAVVSIQMENSRIDGDLGNIQDTNEVCEIWTGAEGLSEIPPVGDERNSKDEVYCNDNGDNQVLGGDPDCLVLKNHLQPMRRSFSMDSSTAVTMHLVDTDNGPSESELRSVNWVESTEKTHSTDGETSSSFKLMGSSSTAQCL